jgi:hypothetical protein
MAGSMMGIEALVHVVGAVLSDQINAGEGIEGQFDLEKIGIKEAGMSQDEMEEGDTTEPMDDVVEDAAM